MNKLEPRDAWSWDELETPLGTLWLAVDRLERVVGLGLSGKAPEKAHGPRCCRGVRRQLEDYFAGARTHFEVALAPEGTPFQRRVWRALCAIPFGEVRTYRDIARCLNRPGAARAVGRANGANPIPIIIPCHRVIAADGSIGGYSGGLQVKRKLLAHERAPLTRVPLGAA
jgi:methylated-DNA-[protein]-cysteine S-methyltransferase